MARGDGSPSTQPVAGYYRVSQARDGMKAPEIYEDEIRRYCSYRELELGEIFSDIDFSGYRNSEKRPALSELVRRRQEFSGVVVPKLSRFGRSVKHLMELFDIFDSDGIALVLLDVAIDTSTSEGRLLRNVKATFAQYESEVRGDYTRANARYRTEQGLPFGGPAPFGYVKAGKTYAPDPDRAPWVRFMFQRYAAGASLNGIARELAEHGILTTYGKVWQPGKVGRLLDNPAYAGLMRLDGAFVAGKWEPLVDPEAWHAIAERRRGCREEWSRPRGPKRLLAGLVWCGDCGRRAYYTARGGGGPGRYRCARVDITDPCRAGGVNAPRTETYVTEQFLERARYYLLQGNSGSFVAERQWELADAGERRMLLQAVIDRVVILPLLPGQRGAGSAGRRLSIEWKHAPTPVEPTHVNRGTKATGRGVRFRREQLESVLVAKDAAASVRGERARSARAEWRRFRNERLIDAGYPATVGRPSGAATLPE